MSTKRPRNFDPQRPLWRLNTFEEFQKLAQPELSLANDKNEQNNTNDVKQNISIPKVIHLNQNQQIVRNTEKELIEKKVKNSLGYVRIPKEQNVPDLELYELTDQDLLYFEEYVKSKIENSRIEVKDFQNLIVFFENQSGKEKIVKYEEAEKAYLKNQIPKISVMQMQELFGYWKSRREIHKRPLLRKLQNAIPVSDDNNLQIAFRPQPNSQEKMKTRKQTDQEGLIRKFHQLTQEFEEHHILAKAIQAREHLKYSIAYEKNEKLSDALFKIDKQANFKFQGLFQCNSSQEYEQMKKQLQQHKNIQALATTKQSRQEILKLLGTGYPEFKDLVNSTNQPQPPQTTETKKSRPKKQQQQNNQQQHSSVTLQQLQESSVNSQAMQDPSSFFPQQDDTISQQQQNMNPNSLSQLQNIPPQPPLPNQMSQLPINMSRQTAPMKNQGKNNNMLNNPNANMNTGNIMGLNQNQPILPLNNNFYQQPMPVEESNNANIITINPQEELRKQQQIEDNYMLATLIASLFLESKKYDVKPTDFSAETIGTLNDKIQALKGAPKEKTRQTEKRKHIQQQQLNKQLNKFKSLLQTKLNPQPVQENKKTIHFNIYRKTGRNGMTQIYRSFDKLGQNENNRKKIVKQAYDYIKPQLNQDPFIDQRELYETNHYQNKIGKFLPYFRQDEFEENNNILLEDEPEDQKAQKEDDDLFESVKTNLLRMKTKIEEIKHEAELEKQNQMELQNQEENNNNNSNNNNMNNNNNNMNNNNINMDANINNNNFNTQENNNNNNNNFNNIENNNNLLNNNSFLNDNTFEKFDKFESSIFNNTGSMIPNNNSQNNAIPGYQQQPGSSQFLDQNPFGGTDPLNPNHNNSMNDLKNFSSTTSYLNQNNNSMQTAHSSMGYHRNKSQQNL